MQAPVTEIQRSYLFVKEGKIRYFIHRNDFVDASQFDQCVVGSILEFEKNKGSQGWRGEIALLIK